MRLVSVKLKNVKIIGPKSSKSFKNLRKISRNRKFLATEFPIRDIFDWALLGGGRDKACGEHNIAIEYYMRLTETRQSHYFFLLLSKAAKIRKFLKI